MLRDIGRHTALLDQGWRVVRYTKHHVLHRPELIVEQVGSATVGPQPRCHRRIGSSSSGHGRPALAPGALLAVPPGERVRRGLSLTHRVQPTPSAPRLLEPSRDDPAHTRLVDPFPTDQVGAPRRHRRPTARRPRVDRRPAPVAGLVRAGRPARRADRGRGRPPARAHPLRAAPDPLPAVRWVTG
ncbi:hypothetical protein [Pseudonocardia humida]|uniref:hypothetical protein n=1 Tax=Pseudonocardia humida TaxID=2800819 RepID=UPI003557B5BB